jgi:hypothetical protein
VGAGHGDGLLLDLELVGFQDHQGLHRLGHVVVSPWSAEVRVGELRSAERAV